MLREEVFHDPELTSALTDWLTHRAYIINMVGGSYQILEMKDWMDGIGQLLVAHILINKWLKFSLRNTSVSTKYRENTYYFFIHLL